jgi:DNA polymerase-3 subunit epsilon
VTRSAALTASRNAARAASGFTIVDLETTGLQASHHRVIEIAVIQTDQGGSILDEWTTLVNPGGPPGPSRIHGITAFMLRNAPTFADVIGELNRRLTGRTIVGHGVGFDLSFLADEYERLGWTFPQDVPHICTLKASLACQPRLRRRRLPDCCRAAGIAMGRRHSALGDARATAQLLATYLARPEHEDGLLGELTDPKGIVWPPVPVRPVTTVHRTGRVR